MCPNLKFHIPLKQHFDVHFMINIQLFHAGITEV